MCEKMDHSPVFANAEGATNPDAIETRHRATITTNALKAIVFRVELVEEDLKDFRLMRWKGGLR